MKTLKKREKIFVQAGSIIIILILGFRFYFLPYYERLEKAKRILPKKRAELKQIISLSEKYLQLSQEGRRLQDKLKSEQNQIISFSLLEELAGDVGIVDKLKSIRPRALKEVEFFAEEALEISLADVTLEQITRYLYEIEATDPALQTSQIRLQPTKKNSSTLNVDFTISIFNKAED